MPVLTMHAKNLRLILLKYAFVTALVGVIVNLVLAIDDLVHEQVDEFSLEKHPHVPPDPKWDSRSPCPALNTLANHGFLPHSGRGITRKGYIRALREGYNLSLPLATFLTYSGHVLLAQYSELSLADLSRHNFIEHNASLGHMDAVGNQEYAPSRVSRELIEKLIAQSSDGEVMTMHDLAEARVLREQNYSRPLDTLHEEIARGEMSMVLGIFGRGNNTVPVRWIREWWLDERFPNDYVPEREQTLFQTVRGSFNIKRLMGDIRAAAGSKR